MNTDDLLAVLNTTQLTHEASALMAWEIGAVDNMDSVAQFMYRGGPMPPQASVRRPRDSTSLEVDPRPEKKYWTLVKEELIAFPCTNDKKYRELWSRINSLEKKGTAGVVLVISGYLGEKFGLHASVLAGFVAVFFYGVLKVGKEAYCRYALPSDA